MLKIVWELLGIISFTTALIYCCINLFFRVKYRKFSKIITEKIMRNSLLWIIYLCTKDFFEINILRSIFPSTLRLYFCVLIVQFLILLAIHIVDKRSIR